MLASPSTDTHLWGCCRGQLQSPQRRSSVGVQGGRVSVGEAHGVAHGEASRCAEDMAVSRKPHSQSVPGLAGPALSASAAWDGMVRATEAVMSATEPS